MKTIWKYVLKEGRTQLDMPHGAKFLSVQRQKDDFVLWVEIPDDKDSRSHYHVFYLILTGGRFPNGLPKLTYRGTCQSQDGNFVGHVYEEEFK